MTDDQHREQNVGLSNVLCKLSCGEFILKNHINKYTIMQEQHFLDGFQELSAGFGVEHAITTSTVAITDFVIVSYVLI